MLALCRRLPAPHLPERLDGGADHVRARRRACPRRPGCRRCPGRAAGRRTPGVVPTLATASISAGVVHGREQRRRSAIGAGDHLQPVVEHARARAARRIVRSTRTGDIGCSGPKSYSVRVLSKTTVAGPWHSSMRRIYSRSVLTPAGLGPRCRLVARVAPHGFGDASSRYAGNPPLPTAYRAREVALRLHTLMKQRQEDTPHGGRAGSRIGRRVRSPRPAPGSGRGRPPWRPGRRPAPGGSPARGARRRWCRPAR